MTTSEHVQWIRKVDINQLDVDHTVQRKLNDLRVKSIAKEFDERFLGTIVLSLRPDGKLIILDGMHRTAGAKMAGYTGKLNALVYEGLTLAEEASLFLHLNNTRQVGAIDRFRVRMVEGDKHAIAINDILKEYGWDVARTTNTRYRFTSVVAIERVYNGVGIDKSGQPRSDLVQDVVTTITEAWQGESAGAHANIVTALGMIFARFGDKIERKGLSDNLASLTPRTLLARGKTMHEARGGTAPASVAYVIVSEYNKRRTTHRLPDWQWK